MDENKKNKLTEAWRKATQPARRITNEVKIGNIAIGGKNPVAVQSMTDCDTNDTEACIAQIGRISSAGGHIIRLTTQGQREAESLGKTVARTRIEFPDVALVADVHFQPQVAYTAADYAHKVRINPGNYNDKGGDFDALLEKCGTRGVALRIGVNHGSLSENMVNLYGDTPEGMVESAMEFLLACRAADFNQVVISMKSSNTRVMVHAYRMLTAAMYSEGMNYPIHLGVTEAGNGIEGRIKSAVGIGALLADGVGDTIRISLTEAPENEIPTALLLSEYFEHRRENIPDDYLIVPLPYTPFEYTRRQSVPSGHVGGTNLPLTYSELGENELKALAKGEIALLSTSGSDPVAEWRSQLTAMNNACDSRPVILHRRYDDTRLDTLAVKAAADFGAMLIDGLADVIYLESTAGVSQNIIDEISLDILQASRARMSKTEFIACPGCGRTLYNLHDTLNTIKSRLSHLKGLKIGVMGCIVNGPGEMADADYGYVGGSPGHISLYKGRDVVRRNLPQSDALDALVEIIKADGRWTEPEK